MSYVETPLFIGLHIPARELARETDPDTSKEAARKLDAGRAGSMRRRLLSCFISGPMTAEEAASAAGYGPEVGAWKRVSDLLNLGLVEDSGKKKLGSSGRPQRILSITDLGLSSLEASGAAGAR